MAIRNQNIYEYNTRRELYFMIRILAYSRVSFCDGSFYDSLLRPLSGQTENYRLSEHHCCNSSVFSLPSALLAPFWCARVSSFSILAQFIVIFPPVTSIRKTAKKKQSKQLTSHSILMSSEPRLGPNSTE